MTTQRRDPRYLGNFNISIDPKVVTLAATSEEHTIEAAYTVYIRKIIIGFTGTGPVRIRFYDDSARTSLVFNSGWITAAMIAVSDWEDATPRGYVDKSASRYIYMKVDGQIGDVVTTNIDANRQA